MHKTEQTEKREPYETPVLIIFEFAEATEGGPTEILESQSGAGLYS